MKSTSIAIALLAAGVNAYPQMNGMAMSKRSMRGGGSGGDNSGYSAPVAGGLREKALQAHNDGRGAYGVPLLEWDDELAQSAQGWANEIGSHMQHSGGGYGENLAWNTNGDVRNMILSQWFDECNDYTGDFSEKAGHYSQCVWRATTHVGCGYNNDNMLVCQYKPAGNVDGGYGSNVPSGRCIVAADLAPGSGGEAPAGGSSPAPSGPSYGGNQGGQAPTGSGPSYSGGKGQAPSGSGPSYSGGQGQAPNRGGHGGHGGRPGPKPQPKPDCDEEDQKPQHGGRPHGRPQPAPVYKAPAPQQAPSRGQRPHGRPRPAPQEDCDDEDQSPSHGGHGGPRGGHRPWGGQGQAPSQGPSYGDDSDSAPSRGGHGGRPSYGDDDSDSAPSRGGNYGGQSGGGRGGNGGYGGRGSSGGHSGGDDDCED